MQVDHVEKIYLSIGFAICVPYLFIAHWLIEKIRVEDVSLFRKLGEPHTFWNNTPKHALLITKWLWRCDPPTLASSRVFAYHAVRVLLILNLIWFFGGLYFFFRPS
jgi:hypothetical protein